MMLIALEGRGAQSLPRQLSQLRRRAVGQPGKLC